MTDSKYVVFKMEDWNRLMPDNDGLPVEIIDYPDPIEDAVVIRKQDVFAAPAFWSYASSISIVAGLLRANGAEEQAKQLQDIADYFSECATEASQSLNKLPD